MAQVRFVCKTPTEVEIDTETGAILSVKVYQGGIEVETDDFESDSRVILDADGDQVQDRATRDAAIDAWCENRWPAHWEFITDQGERDGWTALELKRLGY